MRVLEQSVGERLVVGRGRVAEHAGHEAADRLDDQEGPDLAAGQHHVADRDLVVDQVLAHPLVDALVASAEQREPARVDELVGHRLVEAAAGR